MYLRRLGSLRVIERTSSAYGLDTLVHYTLSAKDRPRTTVMIPAVHTESVESGEYIYSGYIWITHEGNIWCTYFKDGQAFLFKETTPSSEIGNKNIWFNACWIV